jgi:gamma-glutamyltranspeptidase/glutathione hydrolase
VEAMKLAFHDRARFLGDADFGDIPVARLISKEYANSRRKLIDPGKATPSATLGSDILSTPEPSSTTHFSVVDSAGTMVAVTTTLEDAYGSHAVAPGTGFLLNNQMHDFNLKPGFTDRKGNIGTPANVIAPGKRMLSSMSPTLVLKDGKPFLVLGSPGGRTIINTVLCVLTNVIDYQMPIQKAVDFGRFHHQWMPDLVRLESKLPSNLATELSAMGHRFPVIKAMRETKQGDCHAILIDAKSGRLFPGVDRRIRGSAKGF